MRLALRSSLALALLAAAACGGNTTGSGASGDAGDAGDSGVVVVGDDLADTGIPDHPPDGGLLDVDVDAPTPAQCVLEQSTTLPHVHIVFHVASCQFTLAQAAAGITIAYDLVVDQDVPGFVPDHSYWYGSDAANLVLDEVLSGGGQSYCVCDKGLPYPECPLDDGGVSPIQPNSSCGPVTLPAGVYHRTFSWDGRNWGGPSDTDNPKGPPFPAGDYELKVSTAPGTLGDAGALSALGRLLIRLTP